MVAWAAVLFVFIGYAVGDVHLNQKFSQWLDTMSASDLSISASLAKKYNGIDTLASDMPDLVLFLPDNNAWQSVPSWVSSFETDSDLRYSMILASGTQVVTGDDSLESLRVAQREYEMLDSGYGTPYFLEGDALCVGKFDYTLGDYKIDSNHCGRISEPVKLNDVTVFKIDYVVLPEDLTQDL
eukprot:CAMPEP_0113845022 /NCGR_PEP_ID=MMETSP0372-20130328/537_1 /TAXON_ID=340204 /ORGANISM="Lankesteria abbotti" /LENGTH=182 /DNA_ID=CAMNT_0000814041 /DNA_START=1141 /DNA_END=1689 /DNA_ORIENTATION=+ /assembly_acc=CAM_ASM_000359